MKKFMVLFLVVGLAGFLIGCPPAERTVIVEGYLDIDGCDQATLGAEIIRPEFPAEATFDLYKGDRSSMRPWARVAYKAGEDVEIYEATAVDGQKLFLQRHVMLWNGQWYYTTHRSFPHQPIYVIGRPVIGRVDYDVSTLVRAVLFVGILSHLGNIGDGDGADAPWFALPDRSSDWELPAFALFRITDPAPASYQIVARVPGWEAGTTERFTGIVGNPHGCPPPGPETVFVPDTSNLPEDEAVDLVNSFDLIVGTITRVCSDTVATGRVIRSVPPAGASVPVGTIIDLVVSSGPCPPINVTVPDFTGGTEDDARDRLDDLGFDVSVTRVCSDTVAVGRVTSQDPSAGTSVPVGTIINLVVSDGPCTLPNLTLELGLNQTEFQVGDTAILTVEWSGSGTPFDFTATFPDAVGVAGRVFENGLIEFSVLPESADSSVELFTDGLGHLEIHRRLSSDTGGESLPILVRVIGVDDQEVTREIFLRVNRPDVTVPDFGGRTEDEARDVLEGLGLGVSVTRVCSDTVATGRVISQDPPAGTSVPAGTIINLVVSSGPCAPVEMPVPNIVGLPEAEARSAIADAGLNLGAITEVYHPTMTAGRVTSSNPVAGTIVPPGSAVDFSVSLGPEPPPTLSLLLEVLNSTNRVFTVGDIVAVRATILGGQSGFEVRIAWPNATLNSSTGQARVFDFAQVATSATYSSGAEPIFLPVRGRVIDSAGAVADAEVFIRINPN
ncbi:MAG: PASTA domain-containing protein [Candidatus Paceibacterota bacterium]